MAYIGAAKTSITDQFSVTKRKRKSSSSEGGLVKYVPHALGAAALLGLLWAATRKKPSQRSAA